MDDVRIMIVDDHKLYTEALAALIENHAATKMKVSSIVHQGNQVMEALAKDHVDVILLDLNLPEEDGLVLIPQIRKKYKQLHIIVVTMYNDSKFIQESLKLGANGYVLKSNGFFDLINAIKEVSEGNTYVAEGLMIFPKEENGHSNGKFEDPFTIKSKLTKRELEILHLISEAKSNKDIAEILFISDQTVSVHRKNIMRKLNVSNTASLIKYAMDNHLI